jgi:hypothetical protein
MSSGIMQAQATEQAEATGLAQQPPRLTAEAARQLAAILAPHLIAMRAVTAGTPYGACSSADPEAAEPAAGDPAATSTAATSTAAVAQLPPASPSTRIFIAGMLERLSA